MLVSIIMPAKDVSGFIDETLETIVKQTFEDWELIAVDDHSQDDTLPKLKQWSEIDSRIVVFENEGTGIISALQFGLSQVKGKFVTRMDADDLMHERKISLMHDTLAESVDKTIITGKVKYFSSEPISEGYLKYEAWLNEINERGNQWPNIYRECVIASPNWMMRTSELLEMGGFDDLQYPEDYHLTLKWYQNDFQIKCLPDITLLWREHPQRTSRNSEHYDQKHFFELKIRHFLEFEWNEELIIVWGKNVKQKLTTDILKANNVPFEIIELAEYQKIEVFQESQLLVSVYPEMVQREALEIYLEKICRKQGEDWWYL
ncbi:MAG: glycosyltransferase family 2 protein [Cyclobacteriaceae bacterium]